MTDDFDCLHNTNETKFIHAFQESFFVNSVVGGKTNQHFVIVLKIVVCGDFRVEHNHFVMFSIELLPSD